MRVKSLLKKKVVIPVLALTIFFTGTAFKSDFFEIAKQIEIFTTLFKELNMNYVDETNPQIVSSGSSSSSIPVSNEVRINKKLLEMAEDNAFDVDG